jgi:hypothetical protein
VTDIIQTSALVVLQDAPPEVIEVVERGPKGDSGAVASISTDPDNRLTTGSDDGLFVPELAADPLAYYILAKT